MTITLSEKEAKAVYLALSRGAQRNGEDLIGLIMKTSGHQLLNGAEIVALVDKITDGEPNKNYPRYEMIFEGGTHYLPLWQAGSWYDCGWTKVEIGKWVLDSADTKSRRPMTDTDRDMIRDAADRSSENK
jgi:hypothetical protein